MRQQTQDGSWRVAQAGSRFLSNAETHYAMIELELLAISWAAHKCRLFLEGLPQFEIITDHRPLIPILNDYSLDQVENPHLQHLYMKLDQYNYNCTWIRGKDHLATDALSRAPVQHATSEVELDEIDDYKHATVSTLGTTNIDACMEEVKIAGANDDVNISSLLFSLAFQMSMPIYHHACNLIGTCMTDWLWMMILLSVRNAQLSQMHCAKPCWNA